MPQKLAAECRKWADKCVEKAEASEEPVDRARWLVTAEAWLKFAERTPQENVHSRPDDLTVASARADSGETRLKDVKVANRRIER